MRNLKPVYVMCQDGVTKDQLQAVMHGVTNLLMLASVVPHIEVINFGVWRHTPWQQDGELIPWQSVDWYVQLGRKESSRPHQLNADMMLTNLYFEPWQESCPHYDVFVVKDDIYCDEGDNFVIGGALKDSVTVVSTYRFRNLEQELQAKCIGTEVMHELGHVFGLIPDERTNNVTQSLGKHCTNRCVMRQGLRLPDDWVRMTQDRLRYGALCEECQHDLQHYFHER